MTTSPHIGDTRPRNRDFVAKRTMSFLGVFPLGAYVVCHLWTNLSSLGGPEAWNGAFAQSRRHPALLALEVLLGLAILVHGFLGVRLLVRTRPNNLEQRTFGNLKFLLQRVAGLGVGAFIIAHVIKARILPALSPLHAESFQGMREALQEPVTLSVYGLGLLGTSYHLANGLWTFLITWGFTVTPASQRRCQWLAGAFLLMLLSMSALSVYGFLQPLAPSAAVIAP